MTQHTSIIRGRAALSHDLSEMMRGSARGSLVLLIGQIVTAIISSITVIWMSNILNDFAYGQYLIALIPVSIALLFQDLGINASMMRFCSLYRHEQRHSELKSVVMTGLVFSAITSIIISGAMYLFADPISSIFLRRPEITPLVRLAAFSVLGAGLLTTVQSILVGYEIMSMRSFIQILWSILRTIFTVAILLVELGAFGAVLANTIAQIVTGLVGVLLVFIVIKFEKGISWKLNFGFLKTLLSYGLPLSIGTLLGGILGQLYNTMMVIYASTELVGNFGAATNFGVLVTFLTVPISTTLFPLFSKFRKDDPQLITIYRLAVKYTTMLTLPVALVIILLATPLSKVIYDVRYPFVAEYLSLFLLTYVWEGLGGITLGNAISGLGESSISFRSSVLTFIAGSILVFILAPSYQIVGIIIAIIIAPRAGWVYQTIWAKKNMNMTVDWGSSARIYVIAIVAFVLSYLIINSLNLYGWAALIVGSFSYLIIYTLGLPISGALRRDDIAQIQVMTESMGPIRPIINAVLDFLHSITRN